MEMKLKDCKWELKGYWPYVPLLGKSLEVGNELLGVTEWMDAAVPGGVHYDLLKAGYIEDPYFELNSLKCEWVENRWWMYRTSFKIDDTLKGKNLTLVFKGIDYKAHFYLNKEKLGEHEGMYEEVSFDITGKVRLVSENELIVLLENAPQEMGQIGYTSMTRTQKSRFNYKWDFSTRLVNIGIWDDVVIKISDKFALKDTFVYTGLENENGFLNISTRIMGERAADCTIKVQVDLDDTNIYNWQETLYMEKDQNDYNKRFLITDPKLWYPNGSGDQPLYKVKIELFEDDVLSDKEEYSIGIKTIEYKRNAGSGEDTLPYTFVINGMPVYIKGVNLVPFDLLYGNVTEKIYDSYFYLLKKANINMVRVWGGGIIEKEYFYHLCDVNGIMVWQEFIQSSSGINNVPSTDPVFMKLLKKSAVQAVKVKRNRTCHTVWSGGNELTDEKGLPATYENENIQMLKNIVDIYDPGKLFLPTSASGPNEFLNVEDLGKNHDVHGGWKYEGIEKHYKTFNKSDSLFHSEFGVDGLSSMETLRRVLGEKNLKVCGMKENLVWRHHGEWWDTLERDSEIFGELQSLEQFVKVSQFMQAEGLRYALESNRRRMFRNSGSIVWQFNEPWPNVSCTCLVDYLRVPKMAYYWMRDSFEPVHVSLSYDKLNYKASETFKGEVYLNSSRVQEIKVRWEILEPNGSIIRTDEASVVTRSDRAEKVNTIELSIPKLKGEIFFIRLSAYDISGKVCSRNIYVFSQRENEIFAPLMGLNQGELKIEKQNDTYKIMNVGTEVCLFIHGKCLDEDREIFINNNFASLFPGEEEMFVVNPVDSKGEIEGFPEGVNIQWDYLNK